MNEAIVLNLAFFVFVTATSLDSLGFCYLLTRLRGVNEQWLLLHADCLKVGYDNLISKLEKERVESTSKDKRTNASKFKEATPSRSNKDWFKVLS